MNFIKIRSGLPLLNLFGFLCILSISGCKRDVVDIANRQKNHTGMKMVMLLNTTFSPVTITINIGDTVTWTNQDGYDHTVTSDAGAFDSGTLHDGQSFSFVFTTSGRYAYHCNFHTMMMGEVIVGTDTVVNHPGYNEIWLQNYAFTSPTLTVDLGDTVTWINKDADDHIVTSDSGKFNSYVLHAGNYFRYRFTSAGIYPYHCSIHPMMKGNIIVLDTVPGHNEVWIKNYTYNPDTITISLNDTIKWINKDAMDHTVTSFTSLFDSGVLHDEASYNHKFTATGTYDYGCMIHAGMTGTVIVQ